MRNTAQAEKVVPATTVSEDILHVTHISGLRVIVDVHQGNMTATRMQVPPDPDTPLHVKVGDVTFFQPTGPSTKYRIEFADYDELMSANPSWSKGKPAGVFRTEDLWHYVDKYRAAGHDGNVLAELEKNAHANALAAKAAADAEALAVSQPVSEVSP